MSVDFGEYKGQKILILKKTPDSKYPFQFGYQKAVLIMEHLEEIKQFIRDNEPEN